MGLTLCKGLVEKMQGDVGVESTPGQGSTFWFTACLGLDPNATTPEAEAGALTLQRILLFEPNPVSARELEKLLRGWQVAPHRVDTEESLLATMDQEEDFDAIIWDVFAQPDAHRWAARNPLFQRVKNSFKEPIILLTRPGSNLDYKPNPVQADYRVINKPIDRDTLLRLLTSLPGAGGQTPAAIAEPPPPRQQHAARILAVDDNPANRQLIAELLKDLGVDVSLAKDGMEALGRCERETFDLIFMDIQMPVIDGLETTRRIRELEGTRRRTPIVALTAHAITDQKAQLLLAGLDDYLSKPVSEGQLIHLIRRWTQMKTKIRPQTDGEVLSNRRQPAPVDVTLSLKLSNNKPDLARDMLRMLVESLAENARAIEQHYKDRQLQQLEAVVHKLHGGASYCGVPELKETSARLDDLLRKQTYNDIHHPVTTLLDAINRLHCWAEEHDLDVLFEPQPAQS